MSVRVHNCARVDSDCVVEAVSDSAAIALRAGNMCAIPPAATSIVVRPNRRCQLVRNSTDSARCCDSDESGTKELRVNRTHPPATVSDRELSGSCTRRVKWSRVVHRCGRVRRSICMRFGPRYCQALIVTPCRSREGSTDDKLRFAQDSAIPPFGMARASCSHDRDHCDGETHALDDDAKAPAARNRQPRTVGVCVSSESDGVGFFQRDWSRTGVAATPMRPREPEARISLDMAVAQPTAEFDSSIVRDSNTVCAAVVDGAIMPSVRATNSDE